MIQILEDLGNLKKKKKTQALFKKQGHLLQETFGPIHPRELLKVTHLMVVLIFWRDKGPSQLRMYYIYS